MSRLPLLDPDDPAVDPEVRRLLGELRALGEGGRLPNVMRAFANHPGALRFLAGAVSAFYRSGLITPAQRELAYLTASAINNCHY
jgi:alkylhydroperoxidase family enzyme